MKLLTPRDAWIVGAPIVLYLLAVNPYVLPDVYDNVMYFQAGQSLLDHGRFEFLDQKIVRWPPGFPTMIAGLFSLGLRSVVAVKLFVVGCVFVSGLLLLRLLRRERARYPEITTVTYLLLPQSLLIGTRMMSEWPFILLSLGFLLLLPKCEQGPRRFSWAVAIGVLLGVATLTRWLGALLGAAIVWQVLAKLRRRDGLRSLGPEALASCIGAAMCLAQVVHAGTTLEELAVPLPSPTVVPASAPAELRRLVEAHPNESADSEDSSDYSLTLPRSLRSADRMANTLVNHVRILHQLGQERNLTARLSFCIVALVMAAGAAIRFWRGAGTPADAYTWVTVLGLSLVGWEPMRYWVAIAPFLIVYVFESFDAASRLFTGTRQRSFRTLGVVMLVGWQTTLLGADAYALFHGNRHGHGGLSLLSSPTPESFYRGRWASFYALASRVRADPTLSPLCIWGEPGLVKYTQAFSGTSGVYFPPKQPIGSLIVLPDRLIAPERWAPLGVTPEASVGPYTLYRVDRTSPLNRLGN